MMIRKRCTLCLSQKNKTTSTHSVLPGYMSVRVWVSECAHVCAYVCVYMHTCVSWTMCVCICMCACTPAHVCARVCELAQQSWTNVKKLHGLKEWQSLPLNLYSWLPDNEPVLLYKKLWQKYSCIRCCWSIKTHHHLSPVLTWREYHFLDNFNTNLCVKFMLREMRPVQKAIQVSFHSSTGDVFTRKCVWDFSDTPSKILTHRFTVNNC